MLNLFKKEKKFELMVTIYTNDGKKIRYSYPSVTNKEKNKIFEDLRKKYRNFASTEKRLIFAEEGKAHEILEDFMMP